MKNNTVHLWIGLSILMLLLSACNNWDAKGTTHILPSFQSTSSTAPGQKTLPLWRFGVSLGQNPLSDYDSYGIALMRFGWYTDFFVNPEAPPPYGMEYVPMVRVKQLKQEGASKVECCVTCGYVFPYEYSVYPSLNQIQITAMEHPGMTWLIGNEMDRVDFGSEYCSRQDEILPELYAQAYHDISYAIKSADKTAQVAIGGVTEFTALRSQYLERVWNEYARLYGLPMPVDIWSIHLYVLQELKDSYGADIPPGFQETSGAQYTILDNKDFSKAWAQVVSFRTWMKLHGQQDKPLIISEYGVTYPAWVDDDCLTYPDTAGCAFSPEEVRDDYMYPSFDAFLNYTDAAIGYPADGNRLVQRWNWFSVDYDIGYCEAGVFYEFYNSYLFHSGLKPENSSLDCPIPAKSLVSLGKYWMHYVQELP